MRIHIYSPFGYFMGIVGTYYVLIMEDFAPLEPICHLNSNSNDYCVLSNEMCLSNQTNNETLLCSPIGIMLFHTYCIFIPFLIQNIRKTVSLILCLFLFGAAGRKIQNFNGIREEPIPTQYERVRFPYYTLNLNSLEPESQYQYLYSIISY